MSVSEILNLLNGYWCVFVGNPEQCIPYACFATKEQADIFRDAIHSQFDPIEFAVWENGYVPKEKP